MAGVRHLLASFSALAFTAAALAADPAPAPATGSGFAAGDAIASRLVTEDLLLAVTKAGDRLVAVGEFGHVIHSDDRGQTWTQADHVPTQVTLTAVDFADDKNGWAVGHDRTIIATADGGKTWSLQYSLDIARTKGDRMPVRTCPEPQAPPPPVEGADEFDQPPTTEGDCTFPDFEGDSMGGGDSFAGAMFNWAGPLIPAQPDKDVPFLGVVFTSATHGIAVGGFSTAMETDDGGKTWTPRRLIQTAADDFHMNGAVRGPGQSIFIPMERGQIYRSTDDGKTWTVISGLLEVDTTGLPQFDPADEFNPVIKTYQGSLWGGIALKNGTVILAGMRGTLWATLDQGASWQRWGIGVTPEPLNGGTELDDGTIVITGNGGAVLVSRDGGASFDLSLSRADRRAVSTAADGGKGTLLLFGEFGTDSRPMTQKPQG
jgi:photosystem II stability/assembly factor-like uncharacterized protein